MEAWEAAMEGIFLQDIWVEVGVNLDEVGTPYRLGGCVSKVEVQAIFNLASARLSTEILDSASDDRESTRFAASTRNRLVRPEQLLFLRLFSPCY